MDVWILPTFVVSLILVIIIFFLIGYIGVYKKDFNEIIKEIIVISWLGLLITCIVTGFLIYDTLNRGDCENGMDFCEGQVGIFLHSGQCYNPNIQSCCNEKVLNGTWARCGETCYNRKTHSCNCQDEIINEPYRVCCGKTFCKYGKDCCYDQTIGPTCYDPDTHRCIRTYIK